MGQVDPRWRKLQQAKPVPIVSAFASLGSFFTDMTDIDTFIGDGLDKLPTSMQQTTQSTDPSPIPNQELEKSLILDMPLDPINEINKVYCMDCVSGMKRMPSDFIDCCITDPPYEVNYMAKLEMLRDMDRGTHKHDEHGHMVDSDGHNATYIDWEGWARELYRIMKKDTHLYVFWAERQSHKLIPILEKNGFKFCQYLVWVKNRPTMDASFGHRYMYEHELIGFFQKGWKKLNREESLRTCLRYKVEDQNNYKHPTQKPIKLIRHLVTNSSNQGDLIFDGFGGSGSSFVAAKQLNRNFIGFEITPYYANVVTKERLEQEQMERWFE
jgi:site-specific DNA-methyltransferase (adenine-specific)